MRLRGKRKPGHFTSLDCLSEQYKTNYTHNVITTGTSLTWCMEEHNREVYGDTLEDICVVKTYPSIDPIVAPPPDIINIHKCHICTHERSYGTTLVTGYI